MVNSDPINLGFGPNHMFYLLWGQQHIHHRFRQGLQLFLWANSIFVFTELRMLLHQLRTSSAVHHEQPRKRADDWGARFGHCPYVSTLYSRYTGCPSESAMSLSQSSPKDPPKSSPLGLYDLRTHVLSPAQDGSLQYTTARGLFSTRPQTTPGGNFPASGGMALL